jgi:hypothetical protein
MPHRALTRALVWAGAAATVAAQQCGTQLSPYEPAQNIAFLDPGGSGNYDNDEDCWTKLHCPGQNVKLDIVNFETEQSCDYLRVYEGSDSRPTTTCRLKELHGDDTVNFQDVVSDGEYMWLHFDTDWSNRENGYQARYSCTSQETTLRTPCSRGADNSCVHAHDGMCDDITLAYADGFGCEANTDCTDCGQQCDGCTGECAEAAAAALGVVIVILLISVFGFGGGMFCCIQQKSKALGSRPQPTAYIASLIICIFVGPLCMWIPFVIDSCYEPRQQQQQVVIVQQQMPGQVIMAQPPAYRNGDQLCHLIQDGFKFTQAGFSKQRMQARAIADDQLCGSAQCNRAAATDEIPNQLRTIVGVADNKLETLTTVVVTKKLEVV